MIIVKEGSITKLDLENGVEAIVSPANGIGVMGAGAAGAIAYSAGSELKLDAKTMIDKHGHFNAGQCYSTESGRLKRQGIKKVYHAVTMKYPGGFTSLDIISKAMRNVLDEALADGIKTIAFPGLGTGIGGLNKATVARTMVKIAMEYTHLIDIKIVDSDCIFINEIKKWVL